MIEEVNVFLFDESGKQINQWTGLKGFACDYNSDKIRHVLMETRDDRELLLMPAANNTVIIETVEEKEK